MRSRTGEWFALCVSPLRYQGAVRDSLHRYKFKGRQAYHRAYGRLLASVSATIWRTGMT